MLREQLVAIAVDKTVEAAKALCEGIDDPGGKDRSAQIAAKEAMQAEAFLDLLRRMRDGQGFEYLRVKPRVKENL